MTPQKRISAKLALFERRIQSLVEGSLGNIFSNQSIKSDELVTHLQKVMQEGCKKLADGRIVAPNMFVIELSSETTQKQPISTEMLVNLGADLEKYALQSHWNLLDRLVVNLVHTETIPCGSYELKSQFHLEQIAQTTTLDSESFSETVSMPENAFLIVNGVDIFHLNTPVVNIGRRPDNHLIIDDPRVSRSHAQLRAIKGNYVVFDLGSTGKTYVNNQIVHQSVLFPGDVISLAGLPIIYSQDDSKRGGTEKVQSTIEEKPPNEEFIK
jgi:hypothetical protein